ncbi:MAG: hypothetical protein HY761_10585 [Candidatus Omnitrophica bacterium]|nr:hypothetical protein [Candidatus Omnitrophota bacterium]
MKTKSKEIHDKPDRNSSHLAGEFFVAAELYRRGYSVAMTLGNAKAIDLYAELETKTINVQVKAIRSKKSIGWPMMRDKVIDNVIYILVNLNGQDGVVDYYILSPSEARSKTKQYETRGIIDLSTVTSKEFHNRWDKIRDAIENV